MKKSRATKQDTPWSIRGISPETRTAVRKAARRSDKSMGKWMERVLWEAAQKELRGEVSAVPAVPLEETLLKIVDRLDAQNARIDAVETRRGFLSFFGWGKGAS